MAFTRHAESSSTSSATKTCTPGLKMFLLQGRRVTMLLQQLSARGQPEAENGNQPANDADWPIENENAAEAGRGNGGNHLSSALLAVNEDSDEPSGVSSGKYAVGFLRTLGASAVYSLLLSLMQLSFEKVLKKETFSVVLEMQIYSSLVATCAATIGLFASGEWRSLHGEMEGFQKGEVAYVMTLVWTAISWQVCSIGVVGLIFLVSSLYSNVISTVSLAITPIASVIVFHDKMNGVKIVSMLLALWGFASYIYQNYLDDLKARRALAVASKSHNESSC